MIKRLAHICIHAEDLSETQTFFCDILGLEKGFEFIKDGAVFGFYLKLGGDTFIEVFKVESAEVGNIDHIAIETDDIDQIISVLRTNGYEASEKKLGVDNTWQSWTRDPNGVRIEFHQYTKESLQFKGGACEVDW